jgi:hypothetical protein
MDPKKPDNINIDSTANGAILDLGEAADFLKVSESWLYKHWRDVGGKKLGGHLRFPCKEDLYERLFGKREGVSLRLLDEGRTILESTRVVSNEKSGAQRRRKKEGGIKKSSVDNSGTGTRNDDYNRHNLW